MCYQSKTHLVWELYKTQQRLYNSVTLLIRQRFALVNVVYENHTLTFTVPKANVATVFGEEYSKDMSSDVQVKIVDDGAVVTSIELHYNLAGDGANLAESEMTVKVVYTYDLERITIE